ncbi:Formate hydrogenlyase subunit 3/Multisubunit Na+/H+ antiporter, MnhD subunit [Thiohalospira halophila DSM 15071]|uniref:Formate hydrogenlyase subunit 3/Multisubunit Na+/H+ antiporter, MnhD subunit n=1 Tax=Thiohalospira halophila DSM 15071 TaxID=1123397 RepID=A0A1I1N9K5_9GAMM|nr:complex I subunit 5 family protein [Thiohalospira halophila]SFC94046.1 Formate hydrogenlyase subunit 3/Multisubunit Na+/H+ antiporter, MnhD subunit [Thiohalospira halophila DSM 15071]
MAEELLFVLIPALPLAWGLLALWPPVRRLVAAGGALPAFPALVAAAVLPAGAGAESPWLLLGTEWGLEPGMRALLAVSALVWAAAGLYARGYLVGQPGRWRFDAFFHLAMAGNLGLIVATDPAAFYTLFALMSLASYGLVVHTRTGAARRAGRIYLVMAMVGEVALLAGLVGVATNHQGLWPALALGLAIKAGVIPLHVWLPLAHPVAPVPASAVLSAAMIKAGLVGWLRFPPPADETVLWGMVLLTLGIVGALVAAAVGLTQRRPKEVLAYSSVSQMGVMVAALGTAWAHPALAGPLQAAVIAYAVHHALTKGTLFLAVGWLDRGGGGAARIALAVAALAMAGLPATGGAAAKALLKEPLKALPEAAGLGATLLALSALATATLMVRLWVVTRPMAGSEVGPAPRPMAVATTAVAAAMLAVPLLWGPLAAGLAASVNKGLFQTLAPLLLAGVLGAWLLRWRGDAPWGPAIPAGDLLALGSRWRRRAGPRRHRVGRGVEPRPWLPHGLGAVSSGLRRAEGGLAAWGGLGLALGVVLGLLAVTLLGG